jgi:hypothetical protein
MGAWQNSTYIALGDVSRVAAAISALFGEEGMRPVARPAPRQPPRYDPMQYADALENNLWGVAVFPGAAGWTVIKTAPFELLAERAPGASAMRLAALGRRLGAGGCQVNLYDSSALILVEMDRAGHCALSGHHPAGGLTFRGHDIAEDCLDVRFDALPLQHLVGQCTHDAYGGPLLDNGELVDRLARTLAGANAACCDNRTMVDCLIPHRPLPVPGAVELYFAWPPGDRSDLLGEIFAHDLLRT